MLIRNHWFKTYFCVPTLLIYNFINISGDDIKKDKKFEIPFFCNKLAHNTYILV